MGKKPQSPATENQVTFIQWNMSQFFWKEYFVATSSFKYGKNYLYRNLQANSS